MGENIKFTDGGFITVLNKKRFSVEILCCICYTVYFAMFSHGPFHKKKRIPRNIALLLFLILQIH